MTNWTMEQVLRRALQLEVETFGEYKKGAQESKIPSMKAMFEFLAEEEKAHIKLIRDKMAELKFKE
jgi:rubrerythrin